MDMQTQNKTNMMYNAFKSMTAAAAIALLLASCGGSAKEKKGDINDLKAKIEKLKKEKKKLDTDIKKLEDDLAKADPKSARVMKLVSVDTIRIQDFSHYIELQGKIDAEGMAYVAPKGQGGLVKAIYVKSGQKVGRGQLILKLDDAMARQGVVAAQQQTGQLKARLAQAQTVLERYENLWKQNIGAEIQVINARADVEALAAQLRAAQAQVAMGAADETQRQHALQSTLLGCDRATHLVEQLLTLSRLEAAEPGDMRAPVDLGAVAQRVVAELSAMRRRRTPSCGA